MDSVEPTRTAFEREWPAADVAHLLDGSLYLDRSCGTADEGELACRIEQLIRYSAETGAEAILFTGSFFGAAVRRAREHVEVPVVTSFDGLVDRALDLDQPLRVLSTTPESARLLVAELEEEAMRRSSRVTVTSQSVVGAMDALLGGAPDRHDDLIIHSVRATEPGSAVLFAQFSMERVLTRSAVVTAAPVIGPASEGTVRLRRLLS